MGAFFVSILRPSGKIEVMRQLTLFLLGVVLAPLAIGQSFEDQLSSAEQEMIGLDKLTISERAALFEVIERYKNTGVTAAVAEVENKAQEEKAQAVAAAAVAAVDDYKKTEEPGMVAKALEVFKKEEAERQRERFTSVIVGKFRGWEGNTSFHLENGEVWRQTNNDRFYPKAAENVPVAIYKSGSGYYRLQILDEKSAWVTVKRVR